MKIQSVDLNGKRTYGPASRAELIEFWVEQKGILVAMNAEKILNTNPVLTDIINNNIGYPDGVGAVRALAKNKIKSLKIPGCELWLDVIEQFSESKKFYLIGSKPEVIEATVAKLKQTYPSINIVGYRDGYLKNGDKEALIQDISEKKADFIFVAMGSPLQEQIMAEMHQAFPACYMGLGGSFNVYTGAAKRAPVLFQRLGCEWLYRLLREPTRIKRQLKLVKFLFLLSLGRI